jgi:hypothetical protein
VPYNYDALRAENKQRYGTDIGRIGKLLLEDRYDKRTHFIFELLQNAEDALRRRNGWVGDRAVRFSLTEQALRISHFGEPFDPSDVVGICGIDQSTKGLTAIGRFGIGFKSVYAFTDRPEVHSGDEAFAIESYVWPRTVPPIQRHPDETVFVLSLRRQDASARDEIAEGLRQLGPRTLLFLRHVEELAWSAGDASGFYLRGRPEELGGGVRRVTILGEQAGRPDVEETWLLFAREVSHGGNPVGHVELGFRLVAAGSESWQIEPVPAATLVAFFPTVLPAHVGILVQGPYRTTPSRDNIPLDDNWNRYLVQETGTLLLEALHWLRDQQMLGVDALQCVPLENEKLKGHLFEPLFKMVTDALASEPLLPRAEDGYVAGRQARLSRTQELRDLVDADQLGELLEAGQPLAWLSSDITADRTPALRQYLMRSLNIAELTPDVVVPRMEKGFLERQSDEWIVKLYTFLAGQPALLRQPRVREMPLVRLQNGTHVAPFLHGEAQAFLPGPAETGFPTVRRSLCSEESAWRLLETLGLNLPDPVDDVIRNILPVYQGQKISLANYASDIDRIIKAFRTDSAAQREKLLNALRASKFVVAIDTKERQRWVAKPDSVYIATERLAALLAGVDGIYLVDERESSLRGEPARALLEAAGATRYLCPVPTTRPLSTERLAECRRAAGCESMSSQLSYDDFTLRGLDALIAFLPSLDAADRVERARLLWEALGELLERRGLGVFSTTYRWFYFYQRSTSFDAAFIRLLNSEPWIPGPDGVLAVPSAVNFEALGWKPNPVLQSTIIFKPPVIEMLAREVGIDPGVLELLKRIGVTSLADFQARFQTEPTEVSTSTDRPGDAGNESPNMQSTGDQEEATSEEPEEPGTGEARQENEHENDGRSHRSVPKRTSSSETDQQRERHPSTLNRDHGGGGRRFISYVAVEAEDAHDPDGLDQQARMELEAVAIDLVLEREPTLQRMPAGNKGFDLIESDAGGEPERWVEVKAMTGTLSERPVGLSPAQFEFARRAQDQYWLYIVEEVRRAGHSRIVKIQNPAGRAGTFTFDHGWTAVAEIDDCRVTADLS